MNLKEVVNCIANLEKKKEYHPRPRKAEEKGGNFPSEVAQKAGGAVNLICRGQRGRKKSPVGKTENKGENREK